MGIETKINVGCDKCSDTIVDDGKTFCGNCFRALENEVKTLKKENTKLREREVLEDARTEELYYLMQDVVKLMSYSSIVSVNMMAKKNRREQQKIEEKEKIPKITGDETMDMVLNDSPMLNFLYKMGAIINEYEDED